MSDFTSDLMKDLAKAADISYDPSKPDGDYVYQNKFTNADARRMDALKTAIIRILLLRARNYMLINNEDSKKIPDRKASVDFSITFVDGSINHKGKCEPVIEPITREKIVEIAQHLEGGGSPGAFAWGGRYYPSSGHGIPVFSPGLDMVGGRVDLGILTEFLNFFSPIEVIAVSPRLQLNCS